MGLSRCIVFTFLLMLFQCFNGARCFVNLEKIHNGITYSMIERILEGDLKYFSNDKDDDRDKDNHSRAKVHAAISPAMRRALISELKYLPEEADTMNAQIAAVVLERALERPKDGMPEPWHFDYYSKRIKRSFLPSIPLLRITKLPQMHLGFIQVPKFITYVIPFFLGLMIRANLAIRLPSVTLGSSERFAAGRESTAEASSTRDQSRKGFVPVTKDFRRYIISGQLPQHCFRVAKQILYLLVIYYRAPGFIINYSRL